MKRMKRMKRNHHERKKRGFVRRSAIHGWFECKDLQTMMRMRTMMTTARISMNCEKASEANMREGTRNTSAQCI